MTQADLINRVNQKLDGQYGSNVARVKATLDAMGDVATETLVAGGEVTFPGGLGKLVVVATKARPGRNPRTGKPVQIKAGRAARFKAGAALKAALKG